MSVDEIARLVERFTDVGVDKVRLTGGEPLLRRDLERAVKRLASNPRIRDLSLTTNGILLASRAEALRRAGLHRITVSLDTLRPERFTHLTRRDRLDEIIAGIDETGRVGFTDIKLNTVVIRGFNDDELVHLVEFAKSRGSEVRFIEYMDVGGATHWSLNRVIARREMLDTLERHYGPVEPLAENGSAPANRYVLPDGTIFGIIASTTEPFCRTCDRSRLTADGLWFLCLYASEGIDLRTPLRAGHSNLQLQALIEQGWMERTDRGAEKRRSLGARGPLYQIEDLRKDPHREMHTRGG